MRPLPIPIAEEPLREYCIRHDIARLAFFGSVLRDDFGADSDVDVLVEFKPDKRIGYLGLAQMEHELSELIGRKVDLNMPESLSAYLRQEVLADAEAFYDAA